MFSDRQVAIGCLAVAIAWFIVMAALQQTWAWTMVPAFVVIAGVGFAENSRYAGIGAAMALIWIVIMTVIHLPAIATVIDWYWSVLCGQNSCNVQSWLSALGGWVAIVAALITIAPIRRQIRMAGQHQVENLELQIGPRLALARRIRDECAILRPQLINYAAHTEPDIPTNEFAVRIEITFPDSQTLQSLLQRFAAEIGTTEPRNCDDLISALRHGDAEAKRTRPLPLGPIARLMDPREYAKASARRAVDYLDRIEADAKAFDARWSVRLGR